MTFGEKLKKLRAENGMTQEDLASKIFVTRTAVSKWETEKGYPGIDSLKLIADTFGVSLDELISADDVDCGRRLDERRAKTMFFVAVVWLAITAAFAVVTAVTKIPYWIIGSAVGTVGYVISAYLATPAYKRRAAKKNAVRYWWPKLIAFVIVAVPLVMSIVGLF